MGMITVKDLGKAYKQYPTRWTRLIEWLDPRNRPRHSLKWVLQNINFTVNPGEAVGIIGVNGAGKSTLLKMITGTTQPTTGEVQISGRVAALLELGMGFHPDFTGRQNVIMAGQLLGFSIDEITQLLPEITAFADIEDYIDEPVRIYSSGMQMRLAFSAATARRPDVLVVDEALSVGDAYFQHKSFDRIRKFRELGTTLLIVSHDKQAIQSVCDRAILLNAGRIAMEGDPEEVMDYYNALLAGERDRNIERRELKNGRKQTISGSREIHIVSVELQNEYGEHIDTAAVGQRVLLTITVRSEVVSDQLVVGFAIKDRLGQTIFGQNSEATNQTVKDIGPGDTLAFTFDLELCLGEGTYSIAVALCRTGSHIEKNYQWQDLARMFNVVNMEKPSFVGAAFLESTMTVKRIK